MPSPATLLGPPSMTQNQSDEHFKAIAQNKTNTVEAKAQTVPGAFAGVKAAEAADASAKAVNVVAEGAAKTWDTTRATVGSTASSAAEMAAAAARGTTHTIQPLAASATDQLRDTYNTVTQAAAGAITQFPPSAEAGASGGASKMDVRPRTPDQSTGTTVKSPTPPPTVVYNPTKPDTRQKNVVGLASSAPLQPSAPLPLLDPVTRADAASLSPIRTGELTHRSVTLAGSHSLDITKICAVGGTVLGIVALCTPFVIMIPVSVILLGVGVMAALNYLLSPYTRTRVIPGESVVQARTTGAIESSGQQFIQAHTVETTLSPAEQLQQANKALEAMKEEGLQHSASVKSRLRELDTKKGALIQQIRDVYAEQNGVEQSSKQSVINHNKILSETKQNAREFAQMFDEPLEQLRREKQRIKFEEQSLISLNKKLRDLNESVKVVKQRQVELVQTNASSYHHIAGLKKDVEELAQKIHVVTPTEVPINLQQATITERQIHQIVDQSGSITEESDSMVEHVLA